MNTNPVKSTAAIDSINYFEKCSPLKYNGFGNFYPQKFESEKRFMHVLFLGFLRLT